MGDYWARPTRHWRRALSLAYLGLLETPELAGELDGLRDLLRDYKDHELARAIRGLLGG